MSQILFADDDNGMRQMVADVLRAAGHEVRLASNGIEALAEIRRALPDLVMLDYRMGQPDGFEVCRLIKADPRVDHLPVLILTGQYEVENRLLGFDAGADDYLAKPFDPRELLARARALLRLSRQSLDRNPTTGIPGGVAAEREFERWQERGVRLALCYFDLDHFKPFADRFGFGVADEVIRDVGRTLRRVSEGRDAFVAHVGGDDFILICRAEDARAVAVEARDDFARAVLRHLPAEVVGSGTYHGTDREGRSRDFPVTALSVAIVYTAPHAAGALADLGAVVAETKMRAKRSGATGIAEAEYA